MTNFLSMNVKNRFNEPQNFDFELTSDVMLTCDVFWQDGKKSSTIY